MISKLLSGRLLVVISLIEGTAYLFLWDETVKILIPLGESVIAKVLVALSLSIVLALTWAIPIFIKSIAYKKDLLEYNPQHFEEKEYSKWFDYFASKKDKK